MGIWQVGIFLKGWLYDQKVALQTPLHNIVLYQGCKYGTKQTRDPWILNLKS